MFQSHDVRSWPQERKDWPTFPYPPSSQQTEGKAPHLAETIELYGFINQHDISIQEVKAGLKSGLWVLSEARGSCETSYGFAGV